MTKKAIKSTIRILTGGSSALDKAYDEAVKIIEGQLSGEAELAKRVLSWITYAKRQLTTEELSYALSVEVGTPELDEDNIPDIEDMISVSAGLVTADEESDVIRLVHYTTQEYFERKGKAWNPTIQEEMAAKCLSYLSFDTFDSGHCCNDEEFELRIKRNPFLYYAA